MSVPTFEVSVLGQRESRRFIVSFSPARLDATVPATDTAVAVGGLDDLSES